MSMIQMHVCVCSIDLCHSLLGILILNQLYCSAIIIHQTCLKCAISLEPSVKWNERGRLFQVHSIIFVKAIEAFIGNLLNATNWCFHLSLSFSFHRWVDYGFGCLFSCLYITKSNFFHLHISCFYIQLRKSPFTPIILFSSIFFYFLSVSFFLHQTTPFSVGMVFKTWMICSQSKPYTQNTDHTRYFFLFICLFVQSCEFSLVSTFDEICFAAARERHTRL